MQYCGTHWELPKKFFLLIIEQHGNSNRKHFIRYVKWLQQFVHSVGFVVSVLPFYGFMFVSIVRLFSLCHDLCSGSFLSTWQNVLISFKIDYIFERTSRLSIPKQCAFSSKLEWNISSPSFGNLELCVKLMRFDLRLLVWCFKF